MSRYFDHAGRPVIAVTGLGLVTSLGEGVEKNWEQLCKGISGIHPIKRFPTHGLKTTIAGTVEFLKADRPDTETVTRPLAISAGDEALASAGIEQGELSAPLFLAAPPVEIEWPIRFALSGKNHANEQETYRDILKAARTLKHKDYFQSTLFSSLSASLAERYGVTGVPVTVSTACASGATAIQLAVEAIRRGETTRALALGVDGSTTAEALIRFSLLSALTTQNDNPQTASRPFSRNRSGFVMAEGAGALVLETLESAEKRGATIFGIVMGCGERADDFHRTRSSPDGGRAIATIKGALDDAGLGINEISYVNAHGTSTPENDKAEYLALSTVFGEQLNNMPVSSNKSMVGHTLSAAGAIEAVFSILTIRDSIMPPTINYDEPDPAIPLDVVPNIARKADVKTVLSNSFGFGGQNACLVLGRNPA